MKRLALLVALALAGAACSSAAAPATTTVPTTPTAVLAARFLHIVAPFDKALSATEAEMPRMTSVSQLSSLEGPIETFSNGLLRIGLGGRAFDDAQSLVSRLALVHADLVTNVSRSTLVRDLSTMYTADNELRADLGLAAAK